MPDLKKGKDAESAPLKDDGPSHTMSSEKSAVFKKKGLKLSCKINQN